eukprot:4679700-Pyramimonas_sp.AAC.1
MRHRETLRPTVEAEVHGEGQVVAGVVPVGEPGPERVPRGQRPHPHGEGPPTELEVNGGGERGGDRREGRLARRTRGRPAARAEGIFQPSANGVDS